eukprot:GILK01010444.1.p1 GENE.GILK01010444.1~~GILK01010444.1.p1  ORF type:complete len:329 (-),score=64.04 GILK01010444.1:160-1146(-)
MWSGTSEAKLEAAEEKLLKRSEVAYERKLVPAGKDRKGRDVYINTIIAGQGKPFVLVHGFGAGVAFFFKNLKMLSSEFTVYVIDMLGMGRSSRPPFIAKTTEEAEEFFVHSLEAWRQAMGLSRMILAGHSFGGYMSAVYAIKYEQYIEKLLLLSAVGVPPRPGGSDADYFKHLPLGRRLLFKTVRQLWEWNFTPQGLVKFAGPAGHWLLRKYTRRRFAYLPEDEMLALEDYIYHLTVATGSSEAALPLILHPGAWAKKPLCDRIQGLQIAVYFYYGSHDWMSSTVTKEIAPAMRHGRIVTVDDAGHHLYLDNPADFFIKIMAAVREEI